MDSYKIFWNKKCSFKTRYNPLIDECDTPRDYILIAEIPNVVINAVFMSKKQALTFLSKIYSTFLSWQIDNKKPSLTDIYCSHNCGRLKVILNPHWWSDDLKDFFRNNVEEFKKTQLWLVLD